MASSKGAFLRDLFNTEVTPRLALRSSHASEFDAWRGDWQVQHLDRCPTPYPYTRIEFIERYLNVSRLTATNYLDALAADGFLLKQKSGRSNYDINVALNTIQVNPKRSESR